MQKVIQFKAARFKEALYITTMLAFKKITSTNALDSQMKIMMATFAFEKSDFYKWIDPFSKLIKPKNLKILGDELFPAIFLDKFYKF